MNMNMLQRFIISLRKYIIQQFIILWHNALSIRHVSDSTHSS